MINKNIWAKDAVIYHQYHGGVCNWTGSRVCADGVLWVRDDAGNRSGGGGGGDVLGGCWWWKTFWLAAEAAAAAAKCNHKGEGVWAGDCPLPHFDDSACSAGDAGVPSWGWFEVEVGKPELDISLESSSPQTSTAMSSLLMVLLRLLQLLLVLPMWPLLLLPAWLPVLPTLPLARLLTPIWLLFKLAAPAAATATTSCKDEPTPKWSVIQSSLGVKRCGKIPAHCVDLLINIIYSYASLVEWKDI